MIKFERYRHIHDLFVHYANQENRSDILDLLNNGIASLHDAENLCRFTWKIAELVNTDEENKTLVLGSTDNTDMLADLSYEISKLMRTTGYEAIWQRISNEEMGEPD
ncbi:MAG TPA: hypothetical protein PKD17_15445 [Cellvibrionaceae bacterium]|nr:hypothetical protein [Cellvibrionaceae bacterium]HMW73222.1 hypothetical protein [Cellvibrionaceae bacterium]HMY38017.1 hypothetical protein [Marinagarivorans sp.]HNG60848.1 hypothetical protein [Cellvibrionaceae bacterium]